MTAIILPFPKAAHRSRNIAAVDALWQEYQRDMTTYLQMPGERNLIRALWSYSHWCFAFDPDSAAQNIAAFIHSHRIRLPAVTVG